MLLKICQHLGKRKHDKNILDKNINEEKEHEVLSNMIFEF